MKFSCVTLSKISISCVAGDKPKNLILKSTAVPHIFTWSKCSTAANGNRNKSAEKRRHRELQQEVQKNDAKNDINVANEEVIEETVAQPPIVCKY